LIPLRSLKKIIKSDYAPNDFSGVDMIREIHERDSKSRNIMLFNIEKSVSDIYSLAKELITKLNLDSNISAVTRLSKQSAKPRPIRITFDSSKSVIDVLKSKKSLSSDLSWSNAWVTTDLTLYQMKFLRSLKAERDRKNSSNNGNWFIKYSRGSPSLAQKN